jgi:Receptor family ligand binding region
LNNTPPAPAEGFYINIEIVFSSRRRFTILNTVVVTRPADLKELQNTESRVMLLYSTREEAQYILAAARDLKLTGENYVWVVTQSVIENRQTLSQFPIGMLGEYKTYSSRRRACCQVRELLLCGG